MARLENLLGVLGIAVADRILAGTGSSEGAALVTLLAHQPRSTGWLGEVLGLTSSGVTRLVDRLTAAGWVERSPGTDARRRDLTLTPAGAQRARDVLAAREGGLGELLDPLDARRRAELEALLETMVGALADDRPAALRVCRLCDRDACCADATQCPLQHTVTDGDG